MRIVYDRPPMFDEINRAFHVIGKGVIFAWGDCIYNPERIDIPPSLFVHEEVHGARQRMADIEMWWRRYIASPEFRFAEELPAHAAEVDYLRQHATNRHERRSAVKIVAKRLASPLYGRLITAAQAEAYLRQYAKAAA